MTITAKNLSFSYEKRFSVLSDISFEIKQGEFLGVFGPNGGGKTTLLKLMLGLLKPTEGHIEMMGKSPEKVSSRVGYVPQGLLYDRLFPISALEVVLQGCLADFKGWGRFAKEEKQWALETLEKVGMGHMAEKPFGTLSGGQIQRTLIARALASKPKVLLLDEATVGVDPKAVGEIFEILLELRKEITIVLVTHELQTIAHEMDRLFCINKDLTVYKPEAVCGHFAMGLYHPPLKKKREKTDD